ncbi:MAG: hypothetical protein ACYDBP_04345 [Leptospirales bacterium]
MKAIISGGRLAGGRIDGLPSRRKAGAVEARTSGELFWRAGKASRERIAEITLLERTSGTRTEVREISRGKAGFWWIRRLSGPPPQDSPVLGLVAALGPVVASRKGKADWCIYPVPVYGEDGSEIGFVSVVASSRAAVSVETAIGDFDGADRIESESRQALTSAVRSAKTKVPEPGIEAAVWIKDVRNKSFPFPAGRTIDLSSDLLAAAIGKAPESAFDWPASYRRELSLLYRRRVAWVLAGLCLLAISEKGTGLLKRHLESRISAEVATREAVERRIAAVRQSWMAVRQVSRSISRQADLGSALGKLYLGSVLLRGRTIEMRYGGAGQYDWTLVGRPETRVAEVEKPLLSALDEMGVPTRDRVYVVPDRTLSLTVTTTGHFISSGGDR